MTEPHSAPHPVLVPELNVTSLDESVGFYRTLGFEVEYSRTDEVFALLVRREEGIRLMLQAEAGPGRRWRTAPLERPFGRGVNFEVSTARVEPLWRSAQEHQHVVVQPIERREYEVADGAVEVVRQFVVADPDGYLWRFSETVRRSP